jgi:hypothetical protein
VQPHRTRSFNLSPDPLFVDEVRDVVGRYLNPPDKAPVLCVDEKSQIQALERTQPAVPAGLTHKDAAVRAWLAERPRYHAHFTPTYASWLNQVERWFGLVTQRAIRRASVRTTQELVRRIDAFVPAYNATARPFAWAATPESILAKLEQPLKAISGSRH